MPLERRGGLLCGYSHRMNYRFLVSARRLIRWLYEGTINSEAKFWHMTFDWEEDFIVQSGSSIIFRAKITRGFFDDGELSKQFEDNAKFLYYEGYEIDHPVVGRY